MIFVNMDPLDFIPPGRWLVGGGRGMGGGAIIHLQGGQGG